MAAPNIEGTSNPAVLSGGSFGATLGYKSGPTVLVSPFTPVTVANAGTVALVQGLNILRTTSDGTIAGAVLNLPTSPSDGDTVTFSTTGAITTVTGTVSGSGVIPAVSATSAGQCITLGYNAAAAKWFRVNF